MGPFFARRRMFVHPFQYRLLAANIFYGLLLALVVGCAVFVPLIMDFESPGLSLEERDRIARQFLNLHDQLWPWLAVTFLIIAVHSVCFAHRIAGPIYRFRAMFKSIAQGHLSIRARLRRHDYLQSDAEVLNDMLASLEAKARQIEEQLRDIQATCAHLPRLVDDRSRARIAATHATLTEQIHRLRDNIEILVSNDRSATNPPHLAPERPSPMRQAGFTLVEIMMVVTLTGAMAGIAIPSYLGYLEKVRIVRAVSEISNLAKEIDGYYYASEDTYPDSLSAIGRDSLLDPWGNPYQYLKIAGNINGGGNGGNQAGLDTDNHGTSTWAWLFPQPAHAGGGSNNQSGTTTNAAGGSGNNSSSTQSGGGGNAGNSGGDGNQGGTGGGGSVVGQARKDRFLVPINSDYDLYSMGKDGNSQAPLGAKASRDDVIRASDGAFIGLASNF